MHKNIPNGQKSCSSFNLMRHSANMSTGQVGLPSSAYRCSHPPVFATMYGAAKRLRVRRSELFFKKTKGDRKDSDRRDAKGSKSYRKTGWRTQGGKTSDEETAAAVAAAAAAAATAL